MSNRIKGFTIVLEDPMNEEDAETIKTALSYFKGVIAVESIEQTSNDFIVESRVRHELSTKLWDVIYPAILVNK